MFKIISFIGLLLWCSASFGQEVNAVLQDKTALVADKFVGVDKFGATYVISAQTLTKITPTQRFTYSDLQLGHITKVSLLNPLKISVFYEGMNTVVLLDDNLSKIQKIDFNQRVPLWSVSQGQTAADHQLWLFSSVTNQVLLYNYQTGETTAESSPISGLMQSVQGLFNACWVLTDAQLLHFNSYGDLLATYPIKNAAQFSVNTQGVIFQKGPHLMWFFPQTGKFQPLQLEQITVKDFYLTEKNLYLYDGNYLYHYTLNFSK